MDETGHKRKRCILAPCLIAHHIKQPTLRSKGNLIVIINVKRSLRNTTFLHGLLVVIQFIDPLVLGFPVRGQGKVGGINIGSHATVKAMHLIRFYKMHYA